jgi:hypothetical protein
MGYKHIYACVGVKEIWGGLGQIKIQNVQVVYVSKLHLLQQYQTENFQPHHGHARN